MSVFEVGAGGTLTNADNISDDATLPRLCPRPDDREVGGTAYLFVAGIGDNGVSVLAVGADGALTNVENVADDATLNIDARRTWNFDESGRHSGRWGGGAASPPRL